MLLAARRRHASKRGPTIPVPGGAYWLLTSTKDQTLSLLDQIDAKLADPKVTLDRELFERASTSMLSDIYPSLVPIAGGSDDGRDAEIADPGGTIGVLITSSRDLAGVLRNLRGSCRQMAKQGVPLRRLILANLAELNASKRCKIEKAANDEGYSVVQIYPRQWYADSLRRNPDWRNKLIQVAGGPYSLSRPPVESLGVDLDSTVGRAEELAALRGATGDLVVSGVPGVGKTHLVAQVDGAVFVVLTTDLSRLADHLLEVDPEVVVLDDAGGRLDVIRDLKAIRAGHQLRFRVIAVCWPHESETVGDLLEGASTVSVGKMTKSELGAILRNQGVTRDAVLNRVLDQARGRPAWAVRLGSLLNDGAASWDDVMRGETVRAEVDRYLRNARISPHAYQVLAVVALLGGIEDRELKPLGDLLGTTLLDLHATIRKVAQSGLLDAEQVATAEGQSVVYSVQPELLAASICADAFFSGEAAPVTPRQLQEAFPDHVLLILLNAVIAEAVGASHPNRPSAAQVSDAASSIRSEQEKRLLSYYATLGPTEAKFVLGLVTDALKAALDAQSELNEPNEFLYLDDANARALAELLAEIAARATRRVGHVEALEFLSDAVDATLKKGRDPDSILKTFFTGMRQVDIGEPARIDDLVTLSTAVANLDPGESPRNAFFEIAARTIAPTWEANYSAPDQPRSFYLRSYLLPASRIADVAEPVLDRLEEDASAIAPEAFRSLTDVLETYVHLSRGFAPTGRLVVTPEHRTASKEIALRLANILALADLTSAMRHRLNDVAAPLGLGWAEDDPLFAALTGHDADAYDAEESADVEADTDDADAGSRYVARYEAKVAAERARIEAAIAPYLSQPPSVLCDRLGALSEELAAAGKFGKVSIAFEYIAQSISEPPALAAWLSSALDRGLDGYAYPLMQALVSVDAMPQQLLERVLASPNARYSAIRIGLEYATGKNLVDLMTAMTVRDFDRRLQDHFVRVTPDALSLLNRHPNRQVAALAITCWALWYEYRIRTNRDEMDRVAAQLEAIPDWVDTMLELEAPYDFDEHTLERALVALACTSPTAFASLLVRHAQKEHYPINDFSEWAPAAAILEDGQKNEVWDQVQAHPHARDLFWALAGGDAAWVADRLVSGAVDEPARLLGPMTIGAPPRLAPDEMALVFAQHAGPELIIASLPDPPSDGGIETAQHRLEQARELAGSKQPDVAAIGEAGIEIFTTRLSEARKYAREQELRGNDWF